MNRIITATTILTILNSAMTQGDTIPYEAEKLQNQRNSAITKIDEKYINELKKLQITYTRKGKLDNANSLQPLIDEIESKHKSNQKYTYSTFNGNLKIEQLGNTFNFISKVGNGAEESLTIHKHKPYNNVIKGIANNYRSQGGKNRFGEPIRGEISILDKTYAIHFCEKAILIWHFKSDKFDYCLLTSPL